MGSRLRAIGLAIIALMLFVSAAPAFPKLRSVLYASCVIRIADDSGAEERYSGSYCAADTRVCRHDSRFASKTQSSPPYRRR